MFEHARAFLPLEGRTPGLVLMLQDNLTPSDLHEVLHACLRSGERWTPVLVEEHATGLVGVPLVSGPRRPLESLASAGQGGPRAFALRPEEVIERVRAARHEINNPLAAALMEVQLQLMDDKDEETRRALDVVQQQLRRIREVIAGLTFSGPPAE